MNIRSLAVAILLAMLTGCSTLRLEITDQDTGLVLQPISQSNIRDVRAKFRQVFCTVSPPSTGNTAPFIYEEAGSAKFSVPCATSSGSP